MMAQDGVTHVLPTFAMICPMTLVARERGKHAFEYLPTFQGDEVVAHYADELGRLGDYYAQLRRTVAASRWPAIAVSDDYSLRLQKEVGLEPSALRTIYPGIELPPAADKLPSTSSSPRCPRSIPPFRSSASSAARTPKKASTSCSMPSASFKTAA